MRKRTILGFFYAPLVFLLIFNCSCRQQEPEVASESDIAVAAAASPVPVESAVLEVAGGNERDLGTISEHDVIPLEFQLRNGGTSPLTIIDVTFSCPCGELLNPPEDLELAPGETYALKMNLIAHKISLGDFSRFLSLDLGNEQFVAITLNGHIQANLDVSPGRVIDLGLLTDSGEVWEKELQIRGVNQLAAGFRLAPNPKAGLFDLHLEERVPGTYTLKVRPKNSLPYKRRFRSYILLPILEPAGLPALKITVKAQVGESIAFYPANFSFREADFSESETLLRSASFGTVPKGEEPAEDTNSVSGRAKSVGVLLFRSSVRREIENIAWRPLFEHLEFDCPAGVRVEKALHENGISLQLYISRSAFAKMPRVSITPRRDRNKFRKINLRMLREKAANAVERPDNDDDDGKVAEGDDEKEESDAD
ncbi:MAG: DUF1573 domain-containing protein [Lentisphaerae bacterium]|nr:DUF1573 domain-containing protein [Lentisphaerota bacterium]